MGVSLWEVAYFSADEKVAPNQTQFIFWVILTSMKFDDSTTRNKKQFKVNVVIFSATDFEISYSQVLKRGFKKSVI